MEIKKELIALSKGDVYTATGDDFVITEDHTIADIERYLVSTGGWEQCVCDPQGTVGPEFTEDNRPSCGQRIDISHRYIRRVTRKNQTMYKIWDPSVFNKQGCLYLGYRTLANGELEHDEFQSYLTGKLEYLKVALVLINERTNPVYVPFSSITCP